MTIRRLPETASVALPAEGGKLRAPSAERNLQPLCDLLIHAAPVAGRALELASGTGQHVTAFARCLPGLHWQPTEPDESRRASINAYRDESGLENLSAAQALDATATGWGDKNAGQSLIVVINLLHLISTPETITLVTEAAKALIPGGRFVVYGPFMRASELTSDGDATFHANLIARDPDIGYKDDFDILDIAQGAGLMPVEVIEMPANNLALILEKPGN